MSVTCLNSIVPPRFICGWHWIFIPYCIHWASAAGGHPQVETATNVLWTDNKIRSLDRSQWNSVSDSILAKRVVSTIQIPSRVWSWTWKCSVPYTVLAEPKDVSFQYGFKTTQQLYWYKHRREFHQGAECTGRYFFPLNFGTWPSNQLNDSIC